MNEANLEPPFIKDIFDHGREEGLREGVEAATRESLLQLIAARGLPVTPDQVARIGAERDTERLLAWLRTAAVASSMDEVLGV